MRLYGRLAAALVASVALAAATPLPAAPSKSVATDGSGALTICRDWFVYDSCATYHKVALPPRIAVGDDVQLTYGSNYKEYTFHVTGIRRHGENCTILSDHSGKGGRGEHIEIAPCGTSPGAE